MALLIENEPENPGKLPRNSEKIDHDAPTKSFKLTRSKEQYEMFAFIQNEWQTTSILGQCRNCFSVSPFLII